MDETAPVPQEDSQSLWSAIKESIRGSHRNYTTGPIGRSILLLAIPMVLEMLMESVFAVVDIYWVSHLGRRHCERSSRHCRSHGIDADSGLRSRDRFEHWGDGDGCAPYR